MTDEIPTITNAPEIPLPKYTMIPKHMNPTLEIGVSDYICSYDPNCPGKYYLNFFDIDGRLWNGLKDDFIVIHNYPDEVDCNYFVKLKKNAKETEDKLKNPQVFVDPTIS